jgi:cytochrome P450
MSTTANVTQAAPGSDRIAPGPPPQFLVGNLSEFRKDALSYLMKLNREYGGIVRFHLGKKTAHLITDPNSTRHVLQENYKNYKKGRPYSRARYVFGDGLITSDGEHWRRQRKLMQPVFHKDQFDEFARIMTGEISAMITRWAQSERDRKMVNIADDLRNLALRISARSLFTTDIEKEADWLQHAFNQVNLWFSQGSRTGYLVPPSFPLPSNLRMKKTILEIDALIKKIIAQRHATKDVGTDLLGMLMAARDAEDGSMMSDLELRDEVMTLLFAAHESTGTTIAWTMYLLSKYPEHARRVREEVARVLGEQRTPGFADLGALPYTKRVIEETMRLYPAGPIIPREVIEDDVIGGYSIPAGSIIFLSPYVTHRDPAYWDNPEAFDPERFTEANVESRNRFSYMPFVLGPRQCIGNHFAMTEMLLAIAMVVQRFEFHLVPGMEVSTVHLRFDEGMWMSIRGAHGDQRSRQAE